MTISFAPSARGVGVAVRRVRSTEFRAGARAIAPYVVGLVPFALVVGATVARSGPIVPRLLSTVLIMGGSAQLAVLQSLDRDAALWVVIVSGALINARLIAYSASLSSTWAASTRRFRALAAVAILDATWGLVQRREAEGAESPATCDDAAARRVYYAGAAVALCVAWTLLVIAGALTGTVVSGGAVKLAGPLSLAVLVMPRLARSGGAALVAGTVLGAVLASPLPSGLDLVVAVCAGVMSSRLTTARRRDAS
jgi:predicted branched-subunit amino acid permease